MTVAGRIAVTVVLRLPDVPVICTEYLRDSPAETDACAATL